MRYTETVMDHFINPRNVGQIDHADGTGVIGSEECGDVLKVWISVQDDTIADIKYQVYGCPAAVACCSMMSELALGRTLDQVRQLTDQQVADALGGLPESKVHCSNLAASALQKALDDYTASKDTAAPIKITALMNNHLPANLHTEHGLAFWIEYRSKKILFDTGQSDLLLKNAEILGIDLGQTDVIILSHGHYDHTGGLQAVLDLAPNALVYLHPNAPAQRYKCTPDNPPKQLGMPQSACQALADVAQKNRLFYTTKPEQVCSGLTITGPVPRTTDYEYTSGPFYADPDARQPDPFADDQALLITTPKGLIVILGCAHAGSVNTLRYAQKLTTQPIHTLIGGLHLSAASHERINKTFHDIKSFDLRVLAPCHCSGQTACEYAKNFFPDSYTDIAENPVLTF